ncbi:Transcriptional regulator, ArsR family [Serinicoccus hydrothermalis]|uniref:Transcriptional regulator, ArsR family n=1 Tax=Serinicoccus hydrothermalis TaxID=1758689 RepID=A0A1B1NET7_9MICO|nr:helix-turn-helix domain-containing protein [Serinicoccus hydrothermalis]ANS79913.1 Transcriptional regulator, ArsR family [Serinicoccus hydrothermalis]
MPARKPSPHHARAVDAATLKAFAHPLRLQMYDYLKDHGAATASMLARAMGENTGQTSYHLRQLERHGLVEEDTARGSARERWWTSVGFSFGRDAAGQDAAARTAAQTVVLHQMEMRNARVQEWVARMETEDEAWAGVATSNEATAMLTVEEADALGEAIAAATAEHLERAKERRTRDGEDGTRRVKLYQLLFPLPPEE